MSGLQLVFWRFINTFRAVVNGFFYELGLNITLSKWGAVVVLLAAFLFGLWVCTWVKNEMAKYILMIIYLIVCVCLFAYVLQNVSVIL